MTISKYLVLGFSFLIFFNAQADVIKPEGEENLGYLKVVMPKVPEGMQFSPFRLAYRNATVQLDTPARLTAGSGCLNVIYVDAAGANSGDMTTDCAVGVKANETVVYTLSLLNFRYKNEVAPVPTVHFGRKLTASDYYQSLYFVWAEGNKALQARYGLNGGAKNVTVVPSGVLRISLPFPKGNVENLTVERGAFISRELTWGTPDFPKRGTLEVVNPKRELPSGAPVSSVQIGAFVNCSNQGIGYLCTAASPNYYGLFSLSNIEQPITPLSALPATSETYALFASHTVGSLYKMAYPFKIESERTTKIAVKRIDVHHPLITKENGEKYEGRGSYTIHTSSSPGVWVPVNNDGFLYTGHGIDVLPGEYKVTVTFSTAQKTETKEYLLDLREKSDDSSPLVDTVSDSSDVQVEDSLVSIHP